MTFRIDRETIRWGIIGCGDVTEVKSGPGFQKATNSALVAVVRRSADKAADYAARHNVPRWYDDAHNLIHDPQVDAVYIATPPGSHMQYTLDVAAAGKPVYVEKPMARTHDECAKMVDACKRAGVPLYVAYYRRRLPRILRVKHLIESGAIGDVRFVQHTLFQRPNPQERNRDTLPWRVIPELAGGGRFLDLASHALDVFDYLFGPVSDATGRAANQAGLYDAEDIVTGNWVHSSGVIGSCTLCFTSFDRIDRCEIVGSKGVITFQVIEGGPVELWTADGKQIFDDPNPPHVQQPLIQSIVDDLRGVGVCPSTGESGMRTNWMMDRMLESYRESAK